MSILNFNFVSCSRPEFPESPTLKIKTFSTCSEITHVWQYLYASDEITY